MKKIIYLVMVVMMASYVNAQGFGNCNFGSYTFGNCAVETSSGGSGGGGDGSSISLAEYYNLFSQFTIDLFRKWFLSGDIPVLEYRIEAPKSVFQGDSVIVNNIFVNEVDNLSVELHCTNFLDLNKNGNIDLEDSFSSFNKKAEPNILNNITISLIVPESQEIGDYLIAGKCELGDGSPNATSSRKIKIMNKQQIEILKDSLIKYSKWDILKDKWFLIVVLLGIIVFAVLLYQAGLLQVILGFIIPLIQTIILNPLFLMILIVIIIYIWIKYF